MKILLINGSPHANGCTFTALNEAQKVFADAGIEAEIFHIGTKPVHGCIACGHCKQSGLNKCIFWDDPCNTLIEKITEADGVIIGSPVYYAGMNGALKALLDRVFYAKKSFAGKPAAAVVSCRRGGASAAFDQINHYFTISNMPVVSSQYWNQIHGKTADEARQDIEGLQTMRTLAQNMIWLLKNNQLGHEPLPDYEPWTPTNFIR